MRDALLWASCKALLALAVVCEWLEDRMYEAARWSGREAFRLSRMHSAGWLMRREQERLQRVRDF